MDYNITFGFIYLFIWTSERKQQKPCFSSCNLHSLIKLKRIPAIQTYPLWCRENYDSWEKKLFHSCHLSCSMLGFLTHSLVVSCQFCLFKHLCWKQVSLQHTVVDLPPFSTYNLLPEKGWLLISKRCRSAVVFHFMLFSIWAWMLKGLLTSVYIAKDCIVLNYVFHTMTRLRLYQDRGKHTCRSS